MSQPSQPDPESKARALRLIYQEGKHPASQARELGCPEAEVGAWMAEDRDARQEAYAAAYSIGKAVAQDSLKTVQVVAQAAVRSGTKRLLRSLYLRCPNLAAAQLRQLNDIVHWVYQSMVFRQTLDKGELLQKIGIDWSSLPKWKPAAVHFFAVVEIPEQVLADSAQIIAKELTALVWGEDHPPPSWTMKQWRDLWARDAQAAAWRLGQPLHPGLPNQPDKIEVQLSEEWILQAVLRLLDRIGPAAALLAVLCRKQRQQAVRRAERGIHKGEVMGDLDNLCLNHVAELEHQLGRLAKGPGLPERRAAAYTLLRGGCDWALLEQLRLWRSSEFDFSQIAEPHRSWSEHFLDVAVRATTFLAGSTPAVENQAYREAAQKTNASLFNQPATQILAKQLTDLYTRSTREFETDLLPWLTTQAQAASAELDEEDKW